MKKSAAWSQTKRRFCRPTDTLRRPPEGRERAPDFQYSTLAARSQPPVYNLRTVNHAGKAAPGARAARRGGPREGREKCDPERGRSPQRAPGSRSPQRGRRGGGAGENPAHTERVARLGAAQPNPSSADGEAHSKRGRPRAQHRPGPRRGRTAAQPPGGRGRSRRARSPSGARNAGGPRDEGQRRGPAASPPRGHALHKAQARAKQGRPNREPAATRGRGRRQTGPASAAGSRGRGPGEQGRAGERGERKGGPGPPAGARRRSGPAKRRRRERAPPGPAAQA